MRVAARRQRRGKRSRHVLRSRNEAGYFRYANSGLLSAATTYFVRIPDEVSTGDRVHVRGIGIVATAYQEPGILQIRIKDPTDLDHGNYTGRPLLVPTGQTVRSYYSNWPQNNYFELTDTNEPLIEIDHVCYRKGSTSMIYLTFMVYYDFGFTMRQEACPGTLEMKSLEERNKEKKRKKALKLLEDIKSIPKSELKKLVSDNSG